MEQSSPLIDEYINYKITVQNRSLQTVEQYKIDLMLFFKYIICSRQNAAFSDEEYDSTDIRAVDIGLSKSVTTAEIYAFLKYSMSRRGNKASARARKLSAIKGYYKYLCVTRRYFPDNPAKDIESPHTRAALPKFLTLDESLALLQAVNDDESSKSRQRDYAIITLFLNCGMRLSELVGIDLTSIDPDLRLLRVVGKGNKERIVYLNGACKEAISAYLTVRSRGEIKDKNALFLSSRGSRISNKTVQWMIYKYLDRAGLGYRKLSTHKLRHTAATLMYQSGQVDIRVLKDILGHEQLNTTQIYTHVSNAGIEEAMSHNPLAGHSGKVSKINQKKSHDGEENGDDSDNGSD